MNKITGIDEVCTAGISNDFYYGVFTVGELLRDLGYDEETDTLFEIAKKAYIEFIESDYNTVYKSEYDCLKSFVDDNYSDQYILSQGELFFIEESWKRFKKARGVEGFGDADLAYEFADGVCDLQPVKRAEAQCNAIVSYIGLLEETE